MTNIAIIGLLKDTNIGDPIICESVEYLCKSIAPQHSYKLLDLKGRSNVNWLFKSINSILKKFSLYFFDRLLFKTYVHKELQNVNYIILAGGGIIECEHYSCYRYLDLITRYAENNNIKIAYNAVGFNGKFDGKILGYNVLKQVVNNKNVISVTVRENLEEMNEKYLNAKSAKLVSDPAVWSADCYGIKKDNNSEMIGINLIRPNIFKEFDYKVSEDDVLKFYEKIIEKLNSQNIKWQLFTNGAKPDYEFGLTLLKKINTPYSEQKLKNTPITGQQFLTVLAEYKGIICFRMHASICSYSLGIPSIAIQWNPKQKFFYENIGYGNRCVTLDCDKIDEIYELLIQSMNNGFDNEKVKSFKNLSKNSLNDILISCS